MQRAYRKYRVMISLTAERKALVGSYRVAQRHAYNWAVERIRSGDGATEYGLYKELTELRQKQEWMRAVPVAMQRAGIQDACAAHNLAARFGRGNLGHRTRKNHPDISVRCPLAPRIVDGYIIRLPCFGDVRAAVPNEVMGHDPRSYEFVKTRSGRYVLYVPCRVTLPAWNAPANSTVKGIDRGVSEPTVVVTLDRDGRTASKDSYDTASPFMDNRGRYQKMQSRMSKMNKHSNRFKRLHARLRKRLLKVRRRRQYAECIAAKHACTDHSPSTIVFEDLKLGAMTRRGRGSHKRVLNREMRFVRHHAVEQRIRNRAEMQGIRVITVDPKYTSQTCARCGHIDKDSRITRDVFKCVKCHYVQHADVNAAIVIGRLGLPQPPDEEQTRQAASEVGTPFVRRELDARLNCFTAVGGPARGHESQVPARSLSRRGMEKQRRSTGGIFRRAAM